MQKVKKKYNLVMLEILFHRELDKGKYQLSDNFEYFEEIVPKRDIVILTNYRIIYAVKNDMFGGWQVSFKKNLILP